MMNTAVLLWLWLQGVVAVQSAKILFYHGPVTTYSHRDSLQPLANALAERGHSVTYFSPTKHPDSHKNITEFLPISLLEFHSQFLEAYGANALTVRARKKYHNDLFSGTMFFDVCFQGCSLVLENEEVLNWAQSNRFDVVIVDFFCNECVYALAHYWSAKMIRFNPAGILMPMDADMMGIPGENSWLPGVELPVRGGFGFKDRLEVFLSGVYWKYKYENYALPRLDGLIAGSVGKLVENMPTTLELVRKFDLLLINSHYSDTFPRPLPPWVVPVGGMNVFAHKGEGRLPKDLMEFIKDAPGFLYISLGSGIQVTSLPESVLQAMLTAVGEVGIPVLWKWEMNPPENAPKNILFKKWLPQREILSNPKIRGFVTQGGHISFQQANCYGVPVIVLPGNGDHDFTARRAVISGIGITLEFAELSAAEFREGLFKILQDPSYMDTAKQMSVRCKDRIQNPIETAVWWTEFAIRNKDLSFLKSESFHQHWWTYRLLDVYFFLFFVILMAVILAISVMLVLIQIVSNMFKTKKASKFKTK